MRVSIQEVEVGPFLVDLTTGRLLRDGMELGLRPQACRVFKTLIQNRGQYVDYEHMITEAWDGIIVSRHTVDVTVGEVKKVLQEFGSWITHRPKVGYRLESPKSEELIRRGWHFLNLRTREGLEKAVTAFEQAVGEDGTDFRTYEGLAAAYLTMGTYGMRAPNDVYPHFMDAIDRAVALIGITPELRLQRAHGLHMFERKFAFAESELLRVYREKPSLTKAYCFLAMLYVCTRQFDKALKIVAEGYRVDPLGPLLPAVEVSVCFLARDFQAAAASGRKSVELHPYVHVGRAYYAQALEFCGLLDEALREYRTLCVISPGVLWPQALEASCLTKLGRKAEAMQILENLETIRATDYIDGYYLALAYDSVGKRDQAFAELERARMDNSAPLCLIDVDPKLDPLRDDARFKQLRETVLTPL